MPIFCTHCERAVAYVNDEKGIVTFLHVLFAPDGKTFCAHCDGKLEIDLSRKAPE